MTTFTESVVEDAALAKLALDSATPPTRCA